MGRSSVLPCLFLLPLLSFGCEQADSVSPTPIPDNTNSPSPPAGVETPPPDVTTPAPTPNPGGNSPGVSPLPTDIPPPSGTPTSDTPGQSPTPLPTSAVGTPTLGMTETPTPTPDPDGILMVEGVFSPTVEVISPTAATFVVTLVDQRVVWTTSGRTWVWDPKTADVIDLGEVLGEGLSAAELADEGVTLLSGTGGIFVLSDGDLVVSPVGTALAAEGNCRMLATPGDSGTDLWLATETSLHLWRTGVLYRVNTGSLPSAGALLAWGAPVKGVPALWVAAADQLYALTSSDSGFLAWPTLSGGATVSLGVDKSGTLWATGGDYLYHRDQSGAWTFEPGQSAVLKVVAHPEADRLFLETQDQLLTFDGRSWSNVTLAQGPLLGLDALGRGWVGGNGTLSRLTEGRVLVGVGLEPGQVLDNEVIVHLVPTAPDRVIAVDGSLDSRVISPESDGGWSIRVDGRELEEGPHLLEAWALYSDTNEAAEMVLHFSTGLWVAPTWGGDIEPLYQANCAQCHGPTGYAHSLDSSQAWQAEIDDILEVVKSGQMPLPPNDPLSATEITLIEDWQAGGFEE